MTQSSKLVWVYLFLSSFVNVQASTMFIQFLNFRKNSEYYVAVELIAEKISMK